MKGFVITMYKVAIIGDKDSILAFKSIGIEVFEVNGRDDARRMVDRLAADDYGVIYITEQIASEIEETIDRYVKSITSPIRPSFPTIQTSYIFAVFIPSATTNGPATLIIFPIYFESFLS